MAAQILLAILFTMAGAASCRATPMMGPGMDSDVQALLHNNSDIRPLPRGWKIDSYTFTDFDVRVQLKNEPADTAVVRLAYPSLRSDKTLVGSSSNFRIELVEGENIPGAAEAARALCERIRKNDSPAFFSSPRMKSRMSGGEYVFRRYLFVPALLAGFALALVLFAANLPLLKKHLMPGGWVAGAALAAILIAGFCLRAQLAPHAPIHADSHGIREIRTIIYPESAEEKELYYGEVYPTVMRGIAGVFGNTDDTVFNINIIFGVLAILCMYALAKALFGSEESALVAALAVSVSPALVLVSGTEAPTAMYLFCGLAGLGLMLVSIKTGRPSLFGLSVLVLAFSASLQLLTALIVPAAILLYFSSEGESEIRSKLAAKASVFIVLGGVWAVFHAMSLSPEKTDQGLWRMFGSVETLRHVFSADNMLADPASVPFAVPLLALAGYALMWWRRPRLAAAMTLILLAAVPLSLVVRACRTDDIRYQSLNIWVFYVLAAAPFSAAVLRGNTVKWRPVAAVAACMIIMLCAFKGLAAMRSGDEEVGEYHFIKDTVKKLPHGAAIRLPVRGAASGRLLADFPDYLGERRILRAETPPSPGPEIYYVGLDCYRYDGPLEKRQAILPTGMRRECAEICGGHPKKLFETTIKAGEFALGRGKRYFALGTRSPVVGFYSCDSGRPLGRR